jgi:hypothetical protein
VTFLNLEQGSNIVSATAAVDVAFGTIVAAATSTVVATAISVDRGISLAYQQNRSINLSLHPYQGFQAPVLDGLIGNNFQRLNL